MADAGGYQRPAPLDWGTVFSEPLRGRVTSVVPLGAAAGTGIQARDVEPGSDFYVTVRLLSHNLPQRQFLGTSYTPVIACETTWPSADGATKRVAVFGADGNAIGGAEPGGAIDLSGTTLAGPMPLNGMMSLRLGLYAGKWNQARRRAINALHAGTKGMLEITGENMASPIVNGLFSALKSCFADGNSACYAAVRRELPPLGAARLQTGTWAVISRGREAPETEDLRLNERSELVGADGRKIRAANFVFAIVANTHESVPVAAGELAAIKARIAQQVRDNPGLTREAFEQMRVWHLMELQFSNRLIPSDLRRATAQVEQMFADALALWPVGTGTEARLDQAERKQIVSKFAIPASAPLLLSPEREAMPAGEAGDAAASVAVEAAKRLGKGMKPDTGAGALGAPERESAETDLRDALADLAEFVINDPKDWTQKAAGVANELRRQRQLGPLIEFVTRIRDGRVRDPHLYYFGALAATDVGDTQMASALLESTLAMAQEEFDLAIADWKRAPSEHEAAAKRALKLHMDTLALKGRQWKAQVAALGRKDPALARAVAEALRWYIAAEAAGTPYESTPLKPDLDFARVNILALVHAADAKGVTASSRKSKFAKGLPLSGWAQRMIDEASQPEDPAAPVYDYVFANAGEASLFLGDEAGAGAFFARYVDLNRDDPFMMNTARRQLSELWNVALEGENRLSDALREMTVLAATGPNSVTLSLKEADFILSAADDTTLLQAKFDGAAGTPVDRLPVIVALSQSVGIVRRPDGSPVGTGFLLRGDLLHPRFGPEFVFLTNDHVVCDVIDYGNHVPSKHARIHFDMPAASGPYQVDEVLWRSPDALHDCTVLRLKNPPTSVAYPIELCETLPPLWLETAQVDLAKAAEVASRVRIIGHPSGRPKEVTFERPFFVDHDGPDDPAMATSKAVNLHYRAPTESGSSGSPVFDATTLKLLAIHHAASKTPLHNRRGPGSRSYRANQGKWIQSIRIAIREALDGA